MLFCGKMPNTVIFKAAFQRLECHIACCGTPVWPSKIHHAFGLLCTCTMHKHENAHSAWPASKLGPRAISSVRKCIFTPHTFKIMSSSAKKLIKHYKLPEPLLHCTHALQHLFILLLASLHYNAGRSANGKEMAFTLWEETGRDSHTHFPTGSPAVNFAPSYFRLQLPSVGAPHVLWIRWKDGSGK